MRNLRVWQDGVYPLFLQILPKETEAVVAKDLYGTGKDTGKVYEARRSLSGVIDMVTIPDQPINVGDEFELPFSFIRITEVIDERPAKGNYSAKDVQWMRCGFEIAQRL